MTLNRPRQVRHTPQVQAQLDRFASLLGVGKPDPLGATLKHPGCPATPGTIECLNANDPRCLGCGWWDEVCREEEE